MAWQRQPRGASVRCSTKRCSTLYLPISLSIFIFAPLWYLAETASVGIPSGGEPRRVSAHRSVRLVSAAATLLHPQAIEQELLQKLCITVPPTPPPTAAATRAVCAGRGGSHQPVQHFGHMRERCTSCPAVSCMGRNEHRQPRYVHGTTGRARVRTNIGSLDMHMLVPHKRGRPMNIRQYERMPCRMHAYAPVNRRVCCLHRVKAFVLIALVPISSGININSGIVEPEVRLDRARRRGCHRQLFQRHRHRHRDRDRDGNVDVEGNKGTITTIAAVQR